MNEIHKRFDGDLAVFMTDTTRLIDLEGAFRSGKTTAALWKVALSMRDHPGIHWLSCRYSDGDTQTKLIPPWLQVLDEMGQDRKWDSRENCYVFPNGSKNYMFGLKTQDQKSRYSKLRGITLAGVYNDQTEELPKDIFLELVGRMSQPGYPHQLIFTPNPPDEDHWLADAFPEDNNVPGRRYYSVPIYVNAHNLAPETIAGLEEAYPPAHPKHRSAVLGKRGMNVTGEPVYGQHFRRDLHVAPITVDRHLVLEEAIDFGKHHPCVVWRQVTPIGSRRYLGGLMGQDLFLEDFLPIVKQTRASWFGADIPVQTCCDPAGAKPTSHGIRKNGLMVLREFGFAPTWDENANAPDVRLAMIERVAGLMRRRHADGEALLIADASRWKRVTKDGMVDWTFLAAAFEAGYVWDEHHISVGSKQVRRPKKDGWFEHGMNCVEYLEARFSPMGRDDPKPPPTPTDLPDPGRPPSSLDWMVA